MRVEIPLHQLEDQSSGNNDSYLKNKIAEKLCLDPFTIESFKRCDHLGAQGACFEVTISSSSPAPPRPFERLRNAATAAGSSLRNFGREAHRDRLLQSHVERQREISEFVTRMTPLVQANPIPSGGLANPQPVFAYSTYHPASSFAASLCLTSHTGYRSPSEPVKEESKGGTVALVTKKKRAVLL